MTSTGWSGWAMSYGGSPLGTKFEGELTARVVDNGQDLSSLDRHKGSFENFMGDVAITLVSCSRKLPCTQWF
jgi:hypothetical protein